MTLTRTSNHSPVELGRELGAGGEGTVYVLANDNRYVAKLYHPPQNDNDRRLRAERGKKLRVMARMFEHEKIDVHMQVGGEPHLLLVWPVDVIEEDGGVAGFIMPCAKGKTGLEPFFSFVLRNERPDLEHIDHKYLHGLAANLCRAVHAVHHAGCIIGDLKASNLMATADGLVTVLDTDSFQLKDPDSGELFRCPVGTPGYIPPEGSTGEELLESYDRFALAVLLFQILMERQHPFQGVYTGEGPPPSLSTQDRIDEGLFPHAGLGIPWKPPQKFVPFDMLDPRLQKLFLRCFIEGAVDPERRPSAKEWQTAIDNVYRDDSRWARCRDNSRHLFLKHYGMQHGGCPWCAVAKVDAEHWPVQQDSKPPVPKPRPVFPEPQVAVAQPHEPVPRLVQPQKPQPFPPWIYKAAAAIGAILCVSVLAFWLWPKPPPPSYPPKPPRIVYTPEKRPDRGLAVTPKQTLTPMPTPPPEPLNPKPCSLTEWDGKERHLIDAGDPATPTKMGRFIQIGSPSVTSPNWKDVAENYGPRIWGCYTQFAETCPKAEVVVYVSKKNAQLRGIGFLFSCDEDCLTTAGWTPLKWREYVQESDHMIDDCKLTSGQVEKGVMRFE